MSRSLQIRSDTSQILEENIPLLKAKVMDMRGIYAKVDQLEVSPGEGTCFLSSVSLSWLLILSSLAMSGHRPSAGVGGEHRAHRHMIL